MDHNYSLTNSFRFVSLYPTSVDLRHHRRDLPKNIIKGPYNNINHYLGTHFHLLREDFIKPIREDLLKYLSDPTQKLLNIKIHEVQFIRKGVKDSDICHCLEIKRGITYFSWNIKRDPKRFMIGSLLIFSKDNFKTIFCGRVVDNNNLLYRKVLVNFETPVVDLKHEKMYLMIECNTFFEPYYHVLKVIQGISSHNFPMKQYLVDATTSVEMPKYLNKIKYNISDSELNDSQLVAINGALSKQLVIIQGPPGTGKTYLGLKVAKQLLSISRIWCNESPMLVISFTNHALDQFLEGLTDSTDRILRFGGQSRSSKMKNYTVRECRKRFYDSSLSAKLYRSQMGPLFKAYASIERKIKALGNQMDNMTTSKPTCVFYFDVLAEGVPEMRGWSRIQKSEQMVSWLLEDDGTMGETPSSTALFANASISMAAVYTTYLQNTHSKGSKYCMLSLSMMDNAIMKLYDRIMELSKGIEKKKKKCSELGNFRQYLKLRKAELKQLNTVYNFLLKKKDYLKSCLKKDFKNQVFLPSHLYQINPFKMPVRFRWQLYQYWIGKYEEYMKVKLEAMIEEYIPVYEDFNEAQEESNLAMMRYQKIIGMTTTMAARMHSTIKALKCPIVIVEEAAEVLEAHIIPVLTEHCEHLILIGDHLQLKPTTADYDIETRYKLGVSLFERMVLNNIKCYTLNVQHRMRPEISSLITPSIYSVLYNHDSVKKFPIVRGVEKCLYFVTHSEPEQSAGNSSKKNIHEAKFLIQLAVYLLKNQYKPEEITILAAYLGQVGALMHEQKEHPNDEVKDVKITSVDNFQGEENKIILLSLVRNNFKKTIGFLATENRVCVALSRAKEGMYVMGNMQQLAANCRLWNNINTAFQTQGAVGSDLPLKCQRHGTIAKVRNPEDFDNLSPNGGCFQLCDIKLKCGHKCKKQCHNDDTDHAKYVCMEPCRRLACTNNFHKCLKRCYQPCGMCMHPLRQKLACGHYMRCFMDEMEDYRCVETVHVRRSCGHKQAITCNELDSDFEEDLDCSFCKSMSAAEKQNTAQEDDLEDIDEIELGLGRVVLTDNGEETDSDLELPEKPEADEDALRDTSFKGFKSYVGQSAQAKEDDSETFSSEELSSNSEGEEFDDSSEK